MFSLVGGEESRVKRAVEWSEYKELKFSMWWKRLLLTLDMKMSRMYGRFLGEVGQ